jgi:hypothetical protein
MPPAARLLVLPALLLPLASGARGHQAPPTSAAPTQAAAPRADRLSTELDRWTAFLRANTSTDGTWTQVKDVSAPVLERARTALASDRRLLAAQLLLAARAQLSAAAYMQAPPASAAKDAAALEAEWKRMGGELGARLAPPARDALEGVQPAALRALGEAALPQARVYYDASLEYGRATMPEAGLFYLGSARAAGETVDVCRSLSGAAGEPAAPVRSVLPEIEALEGELLAAYRPPLSVDRHADFIAASSQLKEARELEEAGLAHGALLRYLQAAQRFFPLRGTKAADADRLAADLRGFDARIAGASRDDSIGRLFLERAREALGASPPETAVAQAVAVDLLPRYLAALEPAGPAPRPAQAKFTVTLVRWPYT